MRYNLKWMRQDKLTLTVYCYMSHGPIDETDLAAALAKHYNKDRLDYVKAFLVIEGVDDVETQR